MKYLVIDNTMAQPIRGVVADKGRHYGNTQMLEWGKELRAYAAWIGKYGGKRLLDAFEVQLINDGMLYIWPVDHEGEPLHDECDAVEIRRYGDGPRIVWEAKIRCDICCGQGHHNLHGEPVEEDDLCITCDSNGYTISPEFETGINGEPLAQAAPQEAP